MAANEDPEAPQSSAKSTLTEGTYRGCPSSRRSASFPAGRCWAGPTLRGSFPARLLHVCPTRKLPESHACKALFVAPIVFSMSNISGRSWPLLGWYYCVYTNIVVVVLGPWNVLVSNCRTRHGGTNGIARRIYNPQRSVSPSLREDSFCFVVCVSSSTLVSRDSLTR
jgi:hypothetical protein